MLRLVRGNRCHLQLDCLARQILALTGRANRYTPSARQPIGVGSRLLDPDRHIIAHPRERIGDAGAKPFKGVHVERGAAGKIKVLAVPWGPVAQAQTRAALERQRGEETLAHHGIQDSIMQKFLLDHGKQIAHALAPGQDDPGRHSLVVIGAVSSSHHRPPIRPCPPDRGCVRRPSGHDTPTVSTRAASVRHRGRSGSAGCGPS